LDLLHPEIDAAMGDEHVVFLEAALVEQHVDPLPRGQLALGVLAVDALLPAAQPRFAAPLLQLFEDVLHGRCPFRFPARSEAATRTLPVTAPAGPVLATLGRVRAKGES
jgi:hypothetical protein